jgi:predicted membrane-bound dolichyl-phosphate-mannose-protein mannosyltransferase
MDNTLINQYIGLIKAAMSSMLVEDIEAIDDFEEENPGIADAAYQAGTASQLFDVRERIGFAFSYQPTKEQKRNG